MFTSLLPVAAVMFVAGGLAFGAAKVYGFGALYPDYESVRKSAQTRAEALTRWMALGGAGGFGFLVLTGTLFEMLPAIAELTLGLGTLTWFATEMYGRERETVLQPMGRRLLPFAGTSLAYLLGAGIWSLLPVLGLAGYTAYAAYKSE